MRNKYSYIGAGLLCVAALTSCSNEEIISEKINAGLTEYTVTAEANFDKEAAGQGTRANVKEDGKSFIWNKGDKLTLWNGTQGYTFQAVESYDESVYYSKVEFKGEASFEEGQEIWGIYPCKESPSADNVFTFTLPQPQVQEGTAPALQKSMCMYAKGTVSGNTVSNMVFQHLTGTLHFTLVNKRGYDIQLEKIVVSADSPVFPLSATLNADGTVSYTDETEQFELDLHNQTISNTESFSAYASVFPTDKMTGDTKLTISIKVAGTEELEVIKEGTVKSLYGEDTSFAKDGYKYVAGKRYGISKTLLPLEGDLGYIENGDTYSVYATNGLIAVLSDPQITGNSAKKILLTQPIDMQGESLTPVENFAATLDAQNNVISNFTIDSSDDGKTGLMLTNTGVIRNLKVENVTLKKENVALLGVLAATNSGKIEGCEISNATIVIESCISNGADIGFVAGESTGANAMISNVSLNGVSSIDVKSGKVNFGGIVGQNGNWNASSVIGASVGKDVTLTYNSGVNNSQFAGIVGWNCGGTVKGCSSAATINPNQASHFGGVVASNIGSASVFASYCCGNIADIASGSNAGGVVAANDGKLIGCYSSVANTGDFGGLCGKANGTITDCYFYNCNNGKREGSANVASMKVAGADELKTKVSSLNSAISDSGFEYIVNDDANEPLKLRAIN